MRRNVKDYKVLNDYKNDNSDSRECRWPRRPGVQLPLIFLLCLSPRTFNKHHFSSYHFTICIVNVSPQNTLFAPPLKKIPCPPPKKKIVPVHRPNGFQKLVCSSFHLESKYIHRPLTSTGLYTYFDGIASSVSQEDIVVVGTDAAVSTCDVVRYVASYHLDASTVTVRSYSPDNEQTYKHSVTIIQAGMGRTQNLSKGGRTMGARWARLYGESTQQGVREA